jgi:HAD superfamily hydrolase (TIGR01549 family)
MPLKSLLFDLFGTVVLFKPRIPTLEVGDQRWRTTMGWLRETAEAELAGVAFEDFLAALLAVTQELTRGRAPEYREVPSRQRFRRALAKVGVDGAGAADLAERLSQVHMQHLASQTMLPAEHREILERLRQRYRLALVSNFDHAATARRILVDHGIADFFDPIVISDELGRRKPHPAIFQAALDGLGCSAAEALFIGDSIGDDVVGARNSGLRVVWINAANESLPEGAPTPDFVVERLSELAALPCDR